MRDNWSVIDVLQHVRHDWLNRIQLIKGNLALGKTEQANHVIDDIVIQMQQEAMLVNSGLPLVAQMLITHNWNGYRFQVEYEVLNPIGPVELDDQRLSAWLKVFFQRLNEAVDTFYDNQLFITLDRDDDQVRFVFQFDGRLEDASDLESWLTYEAENSEWDILWRKQAADFELEVMFKQIGV